MKPATNGTSQTERKINRKQKLKLNKKGIFQANSKLEKIKMKSLRINFTETVCVALFTTAAIFYTVVP